MSDNILDVHRRALSDYRIALGLELRSRQTNAGYSFEKLASRSNIPAETLRSYEKGATLFDILESTAEYIYRASGDPAPNRTSTSIDKITLHAVVLHCGVTPAQLQLMEAHPRRRETISEDLSENNRSHSVYTHPAQTTCWLPVERATPTLGSRRPAGSH